MKRVLYFVVIGIVLLSGCASVAYRLDGATYSDSGQFQSASDALYTNTKQQLVETMRVVTPISKKKLVIGVPTKDVIRGGFIMPSMLTVTASQLIMADNLATNGRKEYMMFAQTIRDMGIYESVSIIDSTGGHLQPAPDGDVLYLFVIPSANTSQWYLNGGKAGQQTVNIDRGQPKFFGKAVSFVNSVKGYALAG